MHWVSFWYLEYRRKLFSQQKAVWLSSMVENVPLIRLIRGRENAAKLANGFLIDLKGGNNSLGSKEETVFLSNESKLYKRNAPPQPLAAPHTACATDAAQRGLLAGRARIEVSGLFSSMNDGPSTPKGPIERSSLCDYSRVLSLFKSMSTSGVRFKEDLDPFDRLHLPH